MKCFANNLKKKGVYPKLPSLVYLIMQENNLQMSNTAADAKDLYIPLSNHIKQISDD